MSAPLSVLLCPTCFAGTENSMAYFVTFVLLTVLPLLSMGAVLFWLIRRIKRAESDQRDMSARSPAEGVPTWRSSTRTGSSSFGSVAESQPTPGGGSPP